MGPNQIAFSLDGTRAYVTNYDGDKIVALDTTPLPDDPPDFTGYAGTGESPEGIVVNPYNGQYLYVVASHSNVVQIFDIEDNPNVPYIEAEVSVGNHPEGIAATPNGTRLFVTNNGSNTVSVIDTTADPPDVIQTINVGNAPHGVIVGDISGVGLRAYAANGGSDTVSVIGAGSSPSVLATVNVGDDPRALAFLPNMSAVLVTNFDGFSIYAIDTSDNSVSTLAGSLGEKPFRMAITADGGAAYVTNPVNNQVSVFDPTDGTLIDEVPVGNTPRGVAILEN
jgi:YVTN family beta-propeller protein